VSEDREKYGRHLRECVTKISRLPREQRRVGSTRQPVPRQDSLTDQMADVMERAVEMGCYDAHDWIRDRWPA
jgi:hypothetical protein